MQHPKFLDMNCKPKFLGRVPFTLKTGRMHYDRWQKGLEIDYGFSFPQSLERAVIKRQCEFFAGRYLAKLLLSDLGFPAIYLPTQNRLPEWPDGILGSITHTRGFVAVIATRDENFSGVGVDWEKMMSEKTWSSIASRIVTDKEAALCPKGFSKSHWGTIIFSLKESIYKAFYPTVRTYFGFETVVILEVDIVSGCIVFEVIKDIGDSNLKGFVGKGFFCNYEDTVLTYVAW